MDNNNSIARIKSLVDRLARRIRLQRVVESLTTALTLQLFFVALVVVLRAPGWISSEARNAAIVLSLLIPLGTALGAWFRSVDKIALAQLLDRTHNLHDRLSTALFLSEREQTAFDEAQIREASQHLDHVDVGRAAPWQRPAEWVALAVACSVIAGVYLYQAPDHKRELPAEIVIRHDKILDDATLALERERLEALKQALEEAGLEDSKELVAALDALLDRAENQEISEKEFLEKLNEIEKKYLDNDDQGREDIAEKLKEAAEALEKEMGKDLAKDPEAKALVDALKQKDYEKAAEAMDALSKKLQDPNLSSKDLERLAKMMEKFSDLIDPNDPKLQKLIDENQALVEKLQKLFDQNKLNDSEKSRLNELKKKAKDLNAKKKGNEGTLVSRQLKQLQRKTKEMADNAKEAAADKKNNKGKQPQDPNAEKKPDFQQEAGKKAQDAAKQMQEQGKEQQKSEARKAAQKQLEELREAMQRSGVKREEGKDGEPDSQKGQQMKEFLDRAKGQKEGDSEKKGEGEVTKGQKEGDGKQSDNTKGDSKETDKKGSGEGMGDSQGMGEGERDLKDETKLDSKRVDEKLDGKKGDGPSRSEVIRSASEEGFATTEYKDVYVDYESVVEEVMDKENVPKGYRFYIKRYFQLIRPQE